MSDNWLPGDAARLTVDIVADGVAADPAVLRCRVESPDGTRRAYAGADITRTAPGQFQLIIALDQPGTWFWRWESDAPWAGATEGSLKVNRGRFA